MKKSEKYTLIIALTALIVSLINTYYQFFYEKHDLTVSVVNSRKAIPKFYGKNKIEAVLIFNNNGNKYAAISYAKFVYSPESDFSARNQTKLPGSDPTMLNPGEKKLVKIEDELDTNLLMGDNNMETFSTPVREDYHRMYGHRAKYRNRIFVGVLVNVVLPSGNATDVLLKIGDVTFTNGGSESHGGWGEVIKLY